MNWIPTGAGIKRFVAELSRRNVFRAAAGYAIAASVVMQAADILLSAFGASPWVLQSLILLMSIGFIPVLAFAWKYEVTDAGIQLESDFTEANPKAKSSRKFDIAVVALLFVAITLLVVDRTTSQPPPPVASEEASPSFDVPLRSIAVTLFANLSSDPESYFAEGLTAEILNRLVQLPELKVAGRGSSFHFTEGVATPTEIGRLLGVNYVLGGSVQRQRNRIRVLAHLTRTSDGYQVWSSAYDRTIADIFEIQDEIATAVASSLDVLMDERRIAHMRAAGIRDVEAWVEFERGLQLFEDAHGRKPTIQTLRDANEHFRRARTRVESFSDAYFHEADLYVHLMLETEYDSESHRAYVTAHREVLLSARQFAINSEKRALIEFDILLYGDDWSDLQDAMDRAFAVSECVDAPYSLATTVAIGRADDVLNFYTRLRDCDPLSVLKQGHVAGAALWAGRTDIGIATARESIERFGPIPWLYWIFMGAALSGSDLETARFAAQRIGTHDDFGGYGAMYHAAIGDLAAARAELDRWQQDHEMTVWTRLMFPAWLGEREVANAIAADIDSRPGGPANLLVAIRNCGCGAPFDLDATPNLRARIREANAPWPPTALINFPAKSW